jgi:hypothetical protein
MQSVFKDGTLGDIKDFDSDLMNQLLSKEKVDELERKRNIFAEYEQLTNKQFFI